nr:MAG TPA: hypothetical protein [Crassvirales sp.]
MIKEGELWTGPLPTIQPHFQNYHFQKNKVVSMYTSLSYNKRN